MGGIFGSECKVSLEVGAEAGRTPSTDIGNTR